MPNVVFVTGSQKKADYLAQLIGQSIEHVKIDLNEIQSLDLHEVVRHKLLQAYTSVQRPVLVEDVSLEFKSLGKLPGTFIKWFIEQMSFQDICNLVDGKDRAATARCVFGYFDGKTETYFEGELRGTVADKPAGSGGFGFDPVFIPEGYTVTRAELSTADDHATYLKMKPLEKVANFIQSLSSETTEFQ